SKESEDSRSIMWSWCIARTATTCHRTITALPDCSPPILMPLASCSRRRSSEYSSCVTRTRSWPSARRTPRPVRPGPLIRYRAPEVLERFLNPATQVREESAPKAVDDDLPPPRAREEEPGAPPGVPLARSAAATDHNPLTVDVPPGRQQGEDRAATTDLDVV